MIKSSDKAMLMNIEFLETEENLNITKNRFSPGDKELLIAARLQGTFSSGYEKAPKLYLDEGRQEQTHILNSKIPTDIVVISDSDFIYDHFWNYRLNDLNNPAYGIFAQNADFILNTINDMVDNNILGSLRNRGKNRTPFYKIQEHNAKIISKFSEINAVLFAQAEKAQKAIDLINQNANKTKKSLTIDDIQKIQTLQKGIDLISFDISKNNLAMQNEIQSFIQRIINFNLFFIPIIIIVLSFTKFIKRKVNVSHNT